MSRKYIAREVLERLRLGEPLGEELIRKFIRFLPELYKDSNGYDDFAKLRHDVFSAFRYDHADRLIGFDLGVCWGAISEEESVSLDYAQAITSIRVNNSKLRELVKKLYSDCTGGHYVVSCEGCEHAYEDYGGYVPLDPDYCVFSDSDRYVGCWKQKRLEAEMRELGVKVD